MNTSGWIFDQNRIGEFPEIHSGNIEWVLGRPAPGVVERANRLLTLAIAKQQRLGVSFKFDAPDLLAGTYCLAIEELVILVKFLESQGWLDLMPANSAMITPSGFIRGDELNRHRSSSAQGFVAMWFAEQMRADYDLGFERGIIDAGYNPIRVDSVEHVGKIDDEIIAQIRKSRFVVADFTGHRAGVYFEAGFALGLDLPVIWTCRKDDIEDLHFDIRQFNCIDWVGPDDLAKRLQNRIEAVIGEGPNKPIAASPT